METFLKEPMGQKPVTAVPGIEPIIAQNLHRTHNITTARNLYGQYLIDPDDFKSLIKRSGGAPLNVQQASQAMETWEMNHDY